jgi:hypothetical protein
MIAFSRKIKIIYYIPQLTIGGTERHLFDLVTHLDKERFEPVIWCPGPWDDIVISNSNAVKDKVMQIEKLPLENN